MTNTTALREPKLCPIQLEALSDGRMELRSLNVSPLSCVHRTLSLAALA
jgi:hypothetical protein